jgi:hypothetical protein
LTSIETAAFALNQPYPEATLFTPISGPSMPAIRAGSARPEIATVVARF